MHVAAEGKLSFWNVAWHVFSFIFLSLGLLEIIMSFSIFCFTFVFSLRYENFSLQQLFDGLCAMLKEVSLVLEKTEARHLSTCQGVKAAANRVLSFIGRFFPVFQKSKVQHFCSSCVLL